MSFLLATSEKKIDFYYETLATFRDQQKHMLTSRRFFGTPCMRNISHVASADGAGKKCEGV